jgi:hypothetical protein
MTQNRHPPAAYQPATSPQINEQRPPHLQAQPHHRVRPLVRIPQLRQHLRPEPRQRGLHSWRVRPTGVHAHDRDAWGRVASCGVGCVMRCDAVRTVTAKLLVKLDLHTQHRITTHTPHARTHDTHPAAPISAPAPPPARPAAACQVHMRACRQTAGRRPPIRRARASLGVD